MLGVLFAVLVLLLGGATCRLFGIGLALAPSVGLAVLAVAASWAIAASLPLTPAVLVVGALAVLLAVRKRRGLEPFQLAGPWTLALLVVAAVLPAALLGTALAGLDVPPNNHDGIFHVELVEALRQGVHFDIWYPRGYHAAVAAVLGLAPWVDSARGTAEVSEGLSVLGVLSVFGLSRALGAGAVVAAIAAVIQALTFIYPYDYQVWGGWPLGMGVVLLVGVWTAALEWIERPSAALAALVGLISGAILLTHGTEVYTASLGLLVIAVTRARRINWRAVLTYLPLAAGVCLVVAGPYLPVLLGWARGGGAVSAANFSDEFDVLAPQLQGGGIWVQIGTGVLGAAGFVDLPVRAALVAIGFTQAWARLARSLWLVWVVVLIVFAFPNQPVLAWVFALTYPWLADQRLLEVASILASVLAAGGIAVALAWLKQQRALRRAVHPTAVRRLGLAAALAAAFLAEGSSVSIYKSLAYAASNEGGFSADDRAAMAWLHQQVRPGDTLANDASVDAGIWAPFKTGMKILLPRSGLEADVALREIVRDNIADLNAAPGATAEACLAGVRYVYYGSRVYEGEVHHFPSLAALAESQNLDEVFRSGDAVVFQTRLTCT